MVENDKAFCNDHGSSPNKIVYRAPWMEIESIGEAAFSIPKIVSSSRWTETPTARHSSHPIKAQWTFFSVYRCIFTFVFVLNAAFMGFIIGIAVEKVRLDQAGALYLEKASVTAASINILAAIGIRNEHAINVLYRLFVPKNSQHLPLWFRKRIAKIYCYGGLHSGAAVSASFWFSLYAAVKLQHDIGPLLAAMLIKFEITLMLLIWLTFFFVIILAHPYIRQTSHNVFELTHRFGGWLLLLLFWVLIILSASPMSSVYRSPPLYLLSVSTLLVIYPYTRLTILTIDPIRLSSHATLVSLPIFSSDPNQISSRIVRISHSPLLESHAFAAIPGLSSPGQTDILISRAGDFTSRFIDSPPQNIWVRTVFAYGVIHVATLFKSVLFVATGAGIGPCLSFLLLQDNRVINSSRHHILWSVHDPLATYGPVIVSAVQRADPFAIIINTRVGGRRNMLALTLRTWTERNAEVVVVIANRAVTKTVVSGLGERGIPAFGPIWDS